MVVRREKEKNGAEKMAIGISTGTKYPAATGRPPELSSIPRKSVVLGEHLERVKIAGGESGCGLKTGTLGTCHTAPEGRYGSRNPLRRFLFRLGFRRTFS